MDRTAGFLRAICDDPDDDGPRLVYADYLEERGDLRAEFIRAQCELAELPEGDERRFDLEATALRLLGAHGKGWAGPIRRKVKGYTFRRGFVEGIKVEAAAFLAHADEFFAAAPIRHAQFVGASGQMEALASSRHLARLRSLDLCSSFRREQMETRRGENWQGFRDRFSAARQSAQDVAVVQLRRLLASPHLGNLEALALEDNRLGVGGVRALVESDLLDRLTDLDLRRNAMGVNAVQMLAESPRLGRLRSLRLGYCRNEDPNYNNRYGGGYSETPEGYINYDPEEEWEYGPGGNYFPRGPLARIMAPLAARLESLDLGACHITSLGLQDFKARPEKLARLSLHHNPIGLPGVRALAASPLMEHLKALDLSSCYANDRAAEVLAGCPALANLTELDLGNSDLTAEGIRALLSATFAPRLTKLNLAGARSDPEFRPRFENEGLKALAEGAEKVPRLAWLDARKQGLKPSAARVLAESPLREQLSWLDLRGNDLGDDGARTLAAVGPWPRLAWLDVRDNRISPPAREALRKAFGPLVRFGPDRPAPPEDDEDFEDEE